MSTRALVFLIAACAVIVIVAVAMSEAAVL